MKEGHAQNSDPTLGAGIQKYSTYEGVRENINLGTGNVIVSVPLLTLPGRNGLNYSVGLVANSQSWEPRTWINKSLGMVITRTGNVYFHPGGVVYPTGGPQGLQCIGNYTFTDENGGVHSYSGIQTNCMYPTIVGGTTTWNPYPVNVMAGCDDSGESICADITACTLTMLDGRWFPLTGCPAQGSTGGSPSPPILTDSNGNQIKIGAIDTGCGNSCGGGNLFPNGTDTDTLGRGIIYSTSSHTIQYKNSSGTPQTITINLQSTPLSACTLFGAHLSGTANVITSVVLPNLLTYIFHYDQCGTLDKVVYPSGGYTRYLFDYTSNIQISARYVCRAPSVSLGATTTTDPANGQRAVSTCSVSEDPTTYSPTIGSPYKNSANTTVDPLGNKTIYQFLNYLTSYPVVESSRQIYQGTSTLLRTVQSTYMGSGALYPAARTTILPNGLQSQIQWDYSGPNLVREKREYGWGQGAPGALVRTVDYGTYCDTKPSGESVYAGSSASGTLISKTTYQFDSYSSISPSGAVQHNSNYNNNTSIVRCNVTAIQRWRNTDGATLTTSMQYDDAGNVLSTTDPLGYQTTTSYGDIWNNSTCAPTGGNAAAYATQVTDPAGLITKHSYNSCTGTVASTNDTNTQVTNLSYDLMDRLVQTTFPDTGQSLTCFSEVSGGSCYTNAFPLKVVSTQKITSGTSPVSKITTAVLDGLARVTQTQLNSDPEGVTYVDTTYDSLERKATVSNPYRTTSDATYGITTYNYDALSRIVKVIPPDGTSTSNNVATVYDGLPVIGIPVMNCTLVTDQAGKQRRSCSDALGRLLEVDEPSNVAGATPGGGSFTISGSEQSALYTCGPNQQCTMWDTGTITVTVNGTAYQSTYGRYDTTSTIASALAASINAGSLVSASASGGVIAMTAKGAGSSTNFPLSTSVVWNQSFFTNPSFAATASGSTMTGGTDGGPGTGPASINTPLVTLYQYDVLDNMLRVDQKGDQPSNSSYWRTRTFTYDSLSEILCAANPEIAIATCPNPDNGAYTPGTVRYAYDNDGNMISKTSPRPNQGSSSTTVVTTFTYNDPDNRLTRKSYSDGFTPTVAYAYDGNSPAGCSMMPPTLGDSYPKGRRTSMCDGSGATSWAHDTMGRIITEERTIAGITNTTSYGPYNLDGSLPKITYPVSGRTITYSYSGAGQAISAIDSANNISFITGATYAAPGGISGFSMQKSGYTVSGALSYNKRLQPLQMYYTVGTVSSSTVSQLQGTSCPTTLATIMSRLYNFGLGTNDNGNVQSITNCINSARSQNFTYDALNRIASAYTTGSNWGENYTIDAWGNLTNRGQVSGKSTYEPLNCPVNTSNQLITCGYGYDAAGNMTSNNGVNYTYDAENHLVLTQGYAYFYDGDGNRVKKCTSTAAFACSSSPTGTLYWRGAGRDAYVETSLTGANTGEYVFFEGQRVARMDTNDARYYFSDHLGTADVIAFQSGVIKEESDYYPYGGEIPVSGSDTNKYKFTGNERDSESGFDYFGARHYTSSLGRFMIPDWDAKPTTVPYANFGNPQSLNLYSYVENNPTTIRDVDGHQDTGIDAAMDRDNRELLAGKITEQQWKERQQARAAGLGVGLAILGAIYTGTEVQASTFLRNLIGFAAVTAPKWEPIVVDAIEGMAPGPPGTLTISRATRLTEQEISAGAAYARQTGTALIESSHEAEEFVDAAKKTYDVMQPGPAGTFNISSFEKSLNRHLAHDDVIILDLRNATKTQVESIAAMLSKYSTRCAAKIRVLNPVQNWGP